MSSDDEKMAIQKRTVAARCRSEITCSSLINYFVVKNPVRFEILAPFTHLRNYDFDYEAI